MWNMLLQIETCTNIDKSFERRKILCNFESTTKVFQFVCLFKSTLFLANLLVEKLSSHC